MRIINPGLAQHKAGEKYVTNSTKILRVCQTDRKIFMVSTKMFAYFFSMESSVML